MTNQLIDIGDQLEVDQEYIDWHGQYHNPECGLRLHKGQVSRQPILGETLAVKNFWLAEAYSIELCSADGFIFRVSQRDAWRMKKTTLQARGAVFYGDSMMKPPTDTLATCDYCEVNPRMNGSKYCRQCVNEINEFFGEDV